MKGETYLYFNDGGTGTDDVAGVVKSSDFTCMVIGGTARVDVFFKSAAAWNVAGDVRLTVPTLTAGDFKNTCKVMSGCLNRAAGNMLVVADAIDGIFVSPFTNITAYDDAN